MTEKHEQIVKRVTCLLLGHTLHDYSIWGVLCTTCYNADSRDYTQCKEKRKDAKRD